MKIEVLFPEVCTLNGDIFNAKYLSECIKGSQIIYTKFNETPYFVSNDDVKIIFLGSMTENNQKLVIDKLKKYVERIEELINKNIVFIVTGNAAHLFGKSIYRNNEEIKALGIFNFYTIQKFDERYHNLYLGKLWNINIIGFKSDFGKIHGNVKEMSFITTEKGIGNNESDKNEGIRKNNFFATTLLGPLLIQNPLFTKYIIGLLAPKIKTLKYEDEIIDAYNIRLKEYKNLKF